MPDIAEMSENANNNIIMYRWAFGGQAASLDELRANFAPGQESLAYLVGKDAYSWDEGAADFMLIGQWQGPVGPEGPGVPVGGTKGQVLIKSGSGDFETGWVDLKLKPTTPLAVGGSVADGFTLEIADATESKRGAVRIATYLETAAGADGKLAVSPVRLKEQLDTIKAEVAAINSMPVGTVFMYAAETPPDGAVVGDGSLAPIADFQRLFDVIGHTHTPEGETPAPGFFYFPNYMDEFLRGHNPASGRAFGSAQGDAMQGHGHNVKVQVGVGTNAGGTRYGGGHEYAENDIKNNRLIAEEPINLNGYGSVRIDTETRPRNKTVLICIKY